MMTRRGLADARKLAGFNQEAFAEEIGVTKHTVSQWETGATGINAKRRPAIAAALGISLAELDRLIKGEPLGSPAAFPLPDRIAPETPSGQENRWLIDADQLPRRPYAAVPPPATGLLLSTDQGESGLSRARRIIERLAPTIRITSGRIASGPRP
jgi:transcriptional regulator with XRE-family HTH domain